MRVPPDATPGVKQAIKEIHERLDRFGFQQAQNSNIRGNRITNAGDALANSDYVTLGQMNEALGIAAPLTAPPTSTNTSTPGDGGTSGGTDDGLGGQGCASAGSTGHVAAGAPLTAVTAGQVVCGTAKEFPQLTAITKNQEQRDKNNEQLLLRMIWHLQQAGFSAGRQQNPSGLISNDKLTVQITGAYRAYDVFQDSDNFKIVLGVSMNQVFPASYVASSGTAD